jgi:hypothetical protein
MVRHCIARHKAPTFNAGSLDTTPTQPHVYIISSCCPHVEYLMPIPLLQGQQIAQAAAANMTQKTTGKTPARAPPSPTASFYDVSDEEEQDYSTISHTSSSKGVKLLFSKSKVSASEHFRVRLYSQRPAGLCPPFALRQRQHSRLHRSCTAEVCSSVLRDRCRIEIQEPEFKEPFELPPSMGSRINACRGRPEHVCQSGHDR